MPTIMIEQRQCCQLDKGDFKPYTGDFHDQLAMPVFCIHCGQIWERHITAHSGNSDCVVMTKALFPSFLATGVRHGRESTGRNT